MSLRITEARRQAIIATERRTSHFRVAKNPDRARKPIFMAVGRTWRGDLLWVSMLSNDRTMAIECVVEHDYQALLGAEVLPAMMFDPQKSGEPVIVGDGNGVFLRGSEKAVICAVRGFIASCDHDAIVIDGVGPCEINGAISGETIIDMEACFWPVDRSAYYFKYAVKGFVMNTLRNRAMQLMGVYNYSRALKQHITFDDAMRPLADDIGHPNK